MKNSIIPALGPLITVKEARKLLGEEANNLTDIELVNLINNANTVFRLILSSFLSSKNVKL